MTLPELSPKLKTGLLIGTTLIFAFFGFHMLYSTSASEYSKEFVAGCIGALITIVATAVLLRSQTRSEILKSQLSATYERKLEAYSLFIDHLSKIHQDERITQKEIDATIDMAVKLSLFCRPVVTRLIRDYIFQIVAYGAMHLTDLEPDQLENFLAWQSKDLGEVVNEKDFDLSTVFVSYGQIVYALRDDLTLPEHANDDDNFEMFEAINDLRNLRGAKTAVYDIESGNFDYS